MARALWPICRSASPSSFWALYTYRSGLRAPAMIAFVKDIMIYIFVFAAIVVVPMKLGGYGAIFDAAGCSPCQESRGQRRQDPPRACCFRPTKCSPSSRLPSAQALALLMYPHSMTGMLSAKSGNTIRINAASASRLFRDARADRPDGLYGARSGRTCHESARCRAASDSRCFSRLVCRLLLRRDRHRRARSRRDYVDRRRQYVHPQYLGSRLFIRR